MRMQCALISCFQNKRLTTAHEAWITFREAILTLLMPVIIVGGILGGVFTPTEAAAVAVFYSLLLGGLVYRELKWKHLPPWSPSCC